MAVARSTSQRVGRPRVAAVPVLHGDLPHPLAALAKDSGDLGLILPIPNGLGDETFDSRVDATLRGCGTLQAAHDRRLGHGPEHAIWVGGASTL